MNAYLDFEDAYKAWREHGGAMNYHGPSQHGPDCWEVDGADALQERITCPAREATAMALVAGGMTAEQIADAMADFVDPAQPEADREAKEYHGAIVLNGPVGAVDTPERYQPKPIVGVPTEMALSIRAAGDEEAQDKQIIWHALAHRLAELRQQEVLECYHEQAAASIARIESLMDRVIR